MTRFGAFFSGLAFVLLVALAGCSDAGSADRDPGPPAAAATPDTAAIRTGLAELVAGTQADRRTITDATCFADALLERSTPDELRAAGILDASYDVVGELPLLSRADAATWVDAQFSCTDFVEASARAQSKLSHGAIDPTTYAQCLRVALTDGQLRAAVIETLSGTWDGPALARFSTAQADCREQATPVF